MPVLLKVKGKPVTVVARVASVQAKTSSSTSTAPAAPAAPAANGKPSKSPANKPIVRPSPNFSPPKSYERKGPQVDEKGRLKGGRGNKKALPLPFDPTDYPPVLNINELSEQERKALDSVQDSSAAGFASGKTTNSLLSDLVYIGRDETDPKGRGRFGNPFKIGAFHGTRDDVCDRHIKNTVVTILFNSWGKDRLKDIRETLGGKRLVCFCKPQRCHGDFLRLLANCPDELVWDYLKQLERVV